jgi:lipoate-protein ligase B
LNLANLRRDVGWYVRMLEEVMIRTSADFGVIGVREGGKTGVWVATEKVLSAGEASPPSATNSPMTVSEKIGAIGVHLSRWVTSHGFAYNVSADLRFFDLIVPCGIAGRKATSLEKILGRSIACEQVSSRLSQRFGEVFDIDMRAVSHVELLDRLAQAEQSLNLAAHVNQTMLAPQEQAAS